MFLAAKEFPLPIEYRFLPLEEVFHEPPADMADRTAIFLDCGNIDRMPVDYETLRDYPAGLVIGVEIYRHQRPQEFNMTRAAPGILSPGGQAAGMSALVVIWTYIP